jgi:hypothetical protein
VKPLHVSAYIEGLRFGGSGGGRALQANDQTASRGAAAWAGGEQPLYQIASSRTEPPLAIRLGMCVAGGRVPGGGVAGISRV